VRVLGVAYDRRDLGELASVAYKLKSSYELLLSGKASRAVEEAKSYAERVYLIHGDAPEALFKALKRLADERDFDLIIGVGYRNVRDALSRLAGALDISMVTDALSLSPGNGEFIVDRGFLSERAVMKAAIGKPAIVLFVPRFARPVEPAGLGGEVVELPSEDLIERVVERKAKSLGSVNLEEAEIIVGVGRGFRAREDLEMAFRLAELLGGQVGCTRPIAADLKWLSDDHWIGISGKRVAPKLYLAIGISGSPQHMSGVQNAKVIVAVNKDKSAPIFKQADYGVVADLYEFLPVLIAKLKARSSRGNG
jgi:electron transfer flavoprotein alpha subunit